MHLEIFVILLSLILSSSSESSSLKDFDGFGNGLKNIQEFDVRRVEKYLVSIHELNQEKTYEHVCTGTVITDLWILTAAHCVYNLTTNTTKTPNLFSISHATTYLGVLIPISKIIIHPILNQKCSGFSNLALLQSATTLNVNKEESDEDEEKDKEQSLELKKLTKSSNDETVIIPDPKLFEKKSPSEVFKGTCYAVSWVLWEDKTRGEIRSWEVNLISRKKCEIEWENINSDYICTVEAKEKFILKNQRSLCQIDPGAVLFCNNIQLGVLHTNLCFETVPTLWTRLDKCLKCLQYTISNSEFPGQIRTISNYSHQRRSFLKPSSTTLEPKEEPKKFSENITLKIKSPKIFIPALYRAYQPFRMIENVPAALKFSSFESGENEQWKPSRIYKRTVVVERPRPVGPVIIHRRGMLGGGMISLIVILSIVVMAGVIILVLCLCCSFLFESCSACCRDDD